MFTTNISSKTLLLLPFAVVCIAEPWFMLHSEAPTLPSPPPEVTEFKQVR